MKQVDKNLFRVVLALGVLLIFTIVIAIVDHFTLQSVVDQVHSGLVHQTKNRATNVTYWCGFDVALKHALTHYITLFRHVPSLHLPSLDCKAIILKTLASTKP